MKFCPECGSNIENMKFCSNCGLDLRQTEIEIPENKESFEEIFNSQAINSYDKETMALPRMRKYI